MMTMMHSQVIADVVASVGCSYPTLVLLRWDAEMLCLSLKAEDVWDGSAIHAMYLDVAISDLVDVHHDAMNDVCVDAVLFLDEVVVDVLL